MNTFLSRDSRQGASTTAARSASRSSMSAKWTLSIDNKEMGCRVFVKIQLVVLYCPIVCEISQQYSFHDQPLGVGMD